MGIPSPTLRHLLPSTVRNPFLQFTPDDLLLHTVNGRVQKTHLHAGRTVTLPFEATRNLLCLSFQGQLLLTLDQASRVALFNAPFLRPFARISLQFSASSAALSPCAKMAAFIGERLEVWHVPPISAPIFSAWRKLSEQVPPGTTASGVLAWSPDSTRLAIGLSSGLVVVYTPAHPRTPGVSVKPLILHGHRAPIIAIRFVGSRGFVTLSTDGALFCWRLRFNDQLDNYKPVPYAYAINQKARNPARRLFIVPLSAKLASRHFVKSTGAKRIYSADVADPLLVVGMSNGVFALYELPDHMTHEDSAFDEGLFELGNLASNNSKRLDNSNPDETASLKSLQGDQLGSDGKGESKDGKDDGDDGDSDDQGQRSRIGFTEITLLHTLSASGGAINRIAFSSKGDWIALASAHAGQIVVWDWRAETHVLKQQAHTHVVSAVAFSPDGRAIATGSKDGRVKLWALQTGFCIATFTNHESEVTAVTFVANDVIVSASLDGTVRAFDIRRYRNFRVMVGPPPIRKFTCVSSDSAGELIAGGCSETFEIIVWSLRTGQILEVLNGHKGPVSGISFRSNRGTLASSSWDRSVRLWDMYERKGSCEVLEHNKEVLDVTFRPDGKELASCTAAGEIVMWNAESADVTGTIDGARDAAPGRQRKSRTVAPEKGQFQSLCYSADGRFLIAGAASKHMCFYYVAEGSRPSLIRKVSVTHNQSFDGLLSKLNSKNLTDSGHVLQEVEDDDEMSLEYGQARIAMRKSLPGAAALEQELRKELVAAEVFSVRACATGGLWAAVTPEGVLVYGDGGIGDVSDAAFDPTHLDVDVTPAAAKKAANAGDYGKALTIALRLNLRECLNEIVESVPSEVIHVVIDGMSVTYFAKLAALLAWRLEHSPFIELNLRWAKSLLLIHGERSTSSAPIAASAVTAVRALQRACNVYAKKLTAIADSNEYMLAYLACSTHRSTMNDE